MAKVRHYRDLRVWQHGVDLSVKLYQLTEDFPSHEIYGLVSQIRRASVSIPSNIAEGFGRSSAEFARYLKIALGSLAELETQLEIALRVAYLSPEAKAELDREVTALGKQLNVLLQKVVSSNR